MSGGGCTQQKEHEQIGLSQVPLIGEGFKKGGAAVFSSLTCRLPEGPLSH